MKDIDENLREYNRAVASYNWEQERNTKLWWWSVNVFAYRNLFGVFIVIVACIITVAV